MRKKRKQGWVFLGGKSFLKRSKSQNDNWCMNSFLLFHLFLYFILTLYSNVNDFVKKNHLDFTGGKSIIFH